MGINVLWLCCGVVLGGLGGSVWRRFVPSAASGDVKHRASIDSDVSVALDVPVTDVSVTDLPVTVGGEHCHGSAEGSEDVANKPLPLHYYQALELAQFKGGFLARTAHELRSPLSSLMGLHQLILTDLCDSPEEERECVAQAYEAAQNFYGLLDTLITVSKLELGSKTLDIQPVDLDLLMGDVEMAVHLPLADRNIRFTAKDVLENPDLPQIKADYGCLRQILIQLILMAGDMKATDMTCEAIASQDKAEFGLVLWDNRSPETWQTALNDWEQMQEIAPQQQDGEHPTTEGDANEPSALSLDLKNNWQPSKLSPGLSLRVQRSLLELMGGRLERVAPSAAEMTTAPTEDATVEATPWDEVPDAQPQLCCWFPLA